MVKRGKAASADAAGKRDASFSGERPAEHANGTAGSSMPIGDAERLKILDAILENMNEGLFLIDEDFKYVLINPASGRILSHDPKQWVGKRAGGYVHPDDRVKSHETVMRTIQGENSSCDVRIMGSDGKYRNLEMHYSLIVVGETFYVLGLVEDITQRKKIEDDLKASEEKYRQLADTPSIAMFTLDLKGSLIFANSTFQNVFGYSMQEAHSINFFTVIHEDDVDRAHRQVSSVSRGKGMHNIEYRVLTKCGAYVPVLLSATPIHDKNGKVVSILCVANDIADLKASEAEISKYREHLEELVEKRTAKLKEEMAERQRVNEELKVVKDRLEYILGATHTGFDIVDADYNVIYVDPAWANTLGDYRGKKCHDYFMGTFAPCDTCAIKTALDTKKTTISEEYLIKEDRHIEVHTIPFRGDDGEWVVAEFNIDVTQRKKSQKALEESEAKFRELADNSPNMIFINRLGKVVYANRKCAETMGYAPDEFYAEGFDFLSLVAPEDRKRVRENAQKRFDGIESAPYEYTLLTKDKRRFEVLINSKPIRYEGEPAILGIITDISQLKRVSAELSQAEDLQRNILRMMPEAVVISDLNGRLTYASHRALEISGYESMDEVAGKNFMELIAPEDNERAFEDLSRLLKSETHLVTYYTLLRKDGTRYDGEVSSALLKGADGKVRAILGIVRDVTESKKVEEALREGEEKYRNLVERARDGIVIVQNEKPVFFNESALRMTGYKGEDAYNTSILEAISDEEKPKIADMYARRMRGEPAPSIYETKLKRPDGSILPVEVNAGVIQYLGKPADMLIIRNLSERKDAEAMLYESETKYKTLFDMAHDAIFLMDGNTFVDCNLKTLAMFKCTREQIIGQQPYNFSPPRQPDGRASDEKAKELIQTAFSGKPQFFEWMHVCPDGSLFDAEVSLNLVRFNAKEYLLAMVRDITKRKKTESELVASETKLHNIMSSMDDLVFGFDTEGRFNFYHASNRDDLYAEPDYFNGKLYSDILPPQASKLTADALERARSGSVSEYEYWLDFGETRRWYVAKLSPTMESGRYRGAVAVVREVTERKAAEENVRSSEERLKALFHASIDGIGVESKGRFAYVNPSFASMYGFRTVEEIVGKCAGDTIAPEDRERMATYAQARESGEHAPNRYQFKALRKDGSTFDAEISISEYMLGHDLFIVGIVKDITEVKKRQSEDVQRQVLEAQFKLMSVITDIVPVMLGSMDKGGRADLVDKLSERLDTVLLAKYPVEMSSQTAQEVAGAYISVLADLGGKSMLVCPDEEACKANKRPCPATCSVSISGCPWDNQKSRNILLCVLCRGIAWRFASRAKKPFDVQLKKSMADGEKNCLVVISEEKD
ncbi:MAG: PAS domain S-box protein [Methanobacteriota archaeon]